MNTLPKIVLIGAGNVGSHLGKRLHEVGIPVVQVYSRGLAKAQVLAKSIGAEACSDLKQLNLQGNIYIIAVHDDVIRMVVEQIAYLADDSRLFVHTSGATPSSVFTDIFKNHGVFYPLQSFSIQRTVDFSQVPICIDAHYQFAFRQLQHLAHRISTKVYAINDEQRAVLHVAAVFVNNFTNHLFLIGEQICENGQVPFEILRPLIQETAAKIQTHSALSMQTGPAIRKDEQTIERHLQYLERLPHYQQLYEILTESIGVSNL